MKYSIKKKYLRIIFFYFLSLPFSSVISTLLKPTDSRLLPTVHYSYCERRAVQLLFGQLYVDVLGHQGEVGILLSVQDYWALKWGKRVKNTLKGRASFIIGFNDANDPLFFLILKWHLTLFSRMFNLTLLKQNWDSARNETLTNSI